jgi:hypothetical protein
MIDVPGMISMKAGIKSGRRIVSWSIRSILSLVRQKIVSSQRKKKRSHIWAVANLKSQICDCDWQTQMRWECSNLGANLTSC